MLFGLNDANLAVPGQTLSRTYHTPEEGIPVKWNKQLQPGILPIDSIRPDAATLKNNPPEITQALASYWRTLPTGSLVTLWHEGNDPNEKQDAPVLKNAHRVAASVAKGIGVHYGVIVGAYPLFHLGQTLEAWVPHDTLWLGVDGYGHLWDEDVSEVFGPFVSQAKEFVPGARLMITETNVGGGITSAQSVWMNQALAFAQANNFVAFNGWANPERVPDVPAIDPALAAELAQACTGGTFA